MPACVESMFSVRETPWHGLGTIVEDTPTSEEALRLAGLDWRVTQSPIFTKGGVVEGYKANIRDIDNKVLGVVTDRYKIIQNNEAFAFTDELLGHGVKYETAGSLQGGRKVWILARLPENYIFDEEEICPYLVFSNTHDGSGAVKVAVTPVRVVCNNTLNLALNRAHRSFSMIHKGDVASKIQEAKDTLFMAESYMKALGEEVERLKNTEVTDGQIREYIEMLLPIEKAASDTQIKNITKLRNRLASRYYDAPDLKFVGNNQYKFINAVSDFAIHEAPLRKTAKYRENLFGKTIDGNPLIDKAYQLLVA